MPPNTPRPSASGRAPATSLTGPSPSAPPTTRAGAPLEVADIVRAHGAEYVQRHRLSPEQHRALRAIVQCRTARLGGHVEACDQCGATRIAYNSCRNRHCPKCQGLQQVRWVEQQVADLLPLEYYHVIFTLPHELNEVAQWQPAAVYDLLFAAANGALQELGQRELGGEVGVTAVLHTWGQTLQRHIHVHCLVTGGALSADGERLQRARPGFLFSVERLSAAYRARYCAGLRRWAAREEGARGAPLAALAEQLSAKAWVVYAQRPLCGAEQVMAYVGRYTQRVALSNARLLSLREGRVRLRYKDYRRGGVWQVMELGAEEFLRRYLQHVLPAGYVRIRHYGLLASRGRAAKLARCRALLRVTAEAVRAEREPSLVLLARLTGQDLRQCGHCGQGRMAVVAQWAAGESPPWGEQVTDGRRK